MGYILFFIYSLILLILKFTTEILSILKEFLFVILWLIGFDYSEQEKYLGTIHEIVELFLPYLFFLFLLKLFQVAFNKARKRKAGVIILASFIQMFLPDPYAERTIKVVQVQKEKKSEAGKKDRDKKDSDKNGDDERRK